MDAHGFTSCIKATQTVVQNKKAQKNNNNGEIGA